MNRFCKNFLSCLSLILFILGSGCILSGCGQDKDTLTDYPVRPVPFTAVKLTDHFWAPKIGINHKVTIPLAFTKSEETGRTDNFKVAAGLLGGGFRSLYPFDDSDVFKNIEGAAYSLQLFPDPRLEAYLDTLIAYIAAAQEPDGYLYTNRTIDPGNTHEMAGPARWSNIEGGSHELYNMGHLYEAAVAHYQATGKRTLLEVALKNASLIDSLFGPGKLEIAPGHQEIEIGLVKLYRVTGEKRYLDLARFFLEVRGPGGSEYHQAHLKPADQAEAVGHAVRAQYMYAAMADVAALTGDLSYLAAIDRLWKDVVNTKTYITGGIGAVRDHEGFGPPYHLPNEEAYCETCAAIANAFWNYRMFLLKGDSKYYDIFEKVLYNGLLSGVSLTGDRFFYPNPLASSGQHQRKEWFGCACCPVNMTRFLPSLPGYVYATRDDNLFVNLYVSNAADLQLSGKQIRLEQNTDFPWSGKVVIRVTPESTARFTLRLRLPGWAMDDAFPGDLYFFEHASDARPSIYLNKNAAGYRVEQGYAVIDRVWKKGDEILISLPMEIRKVMANPLVKADSGLIALQRGPLVYCAEQADMPSGDIHGIVIRQDSKLEFRYDDELLGGIGVITGAVEVKPHVTDENMPEGVAGFTAIPYFAWANRGPGNMRVWIPTGN